jgi:ABC-type amino acid transport substrate-binding protein
LQKADIAVADLTITYEREAAVDFTMPFMSLGIGILFKKHKKEPPKLFSFMSPLAMDVWVYLITSFLGVTLFLFFVARFSPYEWVNPHPCNKEPEELKNNFSMKNTLWFTIGCLMQQGCDIMPRSLSTRVLAASWWFFILILVSSYTANLAAFLTVERMVNPIESAEDLSKQTKIPYGCVKSGSTEAFFKNSNFSTYARMWSFMESYRPSVFVESNSKGVERVMKGEYAYLMVKNRYKNLYNYFFYRINFQRVCYQMNNRNRQALNI